MEAAHVHDPAHGHGGHDDHAHHPTGFMRWVTTTNHKDIGTLYLWFSFVMFSIGGLLAVGIRLELFSPGLQFLDPDRFNQLTTMHGLIMVFGAIMPVFVGFANWQIPMMIGAPDMAFARLNNWSFWLLPFAASLLVLSIGIGAFFLGRDQATPAPKTVVGGTEQTVVGGTAANTPTELSGGIRHKFVGAAPAIVSGGNTPSELTGGIPEYARHQRI